MYASMTDDDLAAKYDYLKTLKPVKNKFVTYKKIWLLWDYLAFFVISTTSSSCSLLNIS